MSPKKFRQPLWDSHDKFWGWHYWGFIDNRYVAPQFLPIFMHPDGPRVHSTKEAMEQSQQFTGRKDKNGTEIYEGSKVNAKPLLLGVSQGEVVWLEKLAGFGVKLLSGIWPIDGLEEIEVIHEGETK